jgi:hypothetical protein
MQTVMQVALEGGAFQAGQEEIYAREVKVDNLVVQVWLWEGVIDGVDVDTKQAAFSL